MVSNLKRVMLLVATVGILNLSVSTYASERLQQLKDASLATKAALAVGAGAFSYGALQFKKYYDTPAFERRHPVLKQNIKTVSSALQVSGMVWAVSRAIEYLSGDSRPANEPRYSTQLFFSTLAGSIINSVLANALSNKETTKLTVAEVPKETLKDFVGDIPPEVSCLVDYLRPGNVRTREIYTELNMSPYKGILLEGPPGNGKTQLVRSIAGEVGVPVLETKSSDYVSMWYGQTEQNIKAVFATARKTAEERPTGVCILFIDEMDGMLSDVMSDTANRIRSEFLVQMDGFKQPSDSATTSWFGAKKQTSKLGHVIVIGATNRPEIIHEAIKRPGRLDRIINIPAPSPETRVKILTHYVKKYTQGCAAPSFWEEVVWEEQQQESYIRAIASRCNPNMSASTLKECCANAVRMFIQQQVLAGKTKDSLKINPIEPELLELLSQEVDKRAKEEHGRAASSSSNSSRSAASLPDLFAGVGTLTNMGDQQRSFVEQGVRAQHERDRLRLALSL